jgi:hypothetical protein
LRLASTPGTRGAIRAAIGYGDVTPVERWLLLGPITAMNGILLFGWSTAVIFEVLRRTMLRTTTSDASGNSLE